MRYPLFDSGIGLLVEKLKMINPTIKIEVTKADVGLGSDHPSKNPLARALKREFPDVTEVWVADRAIQLMVYGLYKPNLSIVFSHNDITTQMLKVLDTGQGQIVPFTTELTVQSIKQVGKWL